MSRSKRGNNYEQVHERSEAHTLAVALLDDHTFERVDQWTPVDEVISVEEIEIEPEVEHCMIISREDYEVMMSCVELVQRSHPGRKMQAVNEAEHRQVLPGAHILTPVELMQLLRKAKNDTFNALMRYTWGNASNLWGAMRNWLAVTHKIAPQHIKGMSGEAIGKLLGVCRAAFNKTEMKLVVEYLEMWGVKGGTVGGSKPVGHRQKKAEQMKGKRHRAADYVRTTTPPELPPLTKEQRERATQMRHDYERKRLADLAGVQPEDIDLDRTRVAA